MVNPREFYERIRVEIFGNEESASLVNRINNLVEEVITKLTDEPQFRMKGEIKICPRDFAIKFWDMKNREMGSRTDMRPTDRDGNCTYWFPENIEDYFFIITIITDNLDSRSDDYIKGLLAHEIAEMSLAYRIRQRNNDRLEKLKPKARDVFWNQLTGQNSPMGSREWEEHEKRADEEAKRLGFPNEILALNMG